MADSLRIKFTKHAIEKFKLLKSYGFEISQEQIIQTVRNPQRLDKEDEQSFATRVLDSKHAIRVVYENREGFLVVITFYPVRRERYDL